MCICVERTIPADLAHRLAQILEAHFTHDAGKQRTIEEALPLLRGEQTYGEPAGNPRSEA
jgi:hypothetical protein